MNYNPTKTRKHPHSDQARRKMAVAAYERQVKPAPINLPQPPWVEGEDEDKQEAKR